MATMIMSSRLERIGNVDNADIDNVKEQTTAFAQSRDSVLLAYIAAAQRGSLAPPNISDMDTTDLIQVIEYRRLAIGDPSLVLERKFLQIANALLYRRY